MGTTKTDDPPVSRSNESDPDRVLTRQKVGQALVDAGFDDVLVLSHEGADRALTPRRRDIIQALRSHEYSSQKELAEDLDRNPGNVKRDVDVLIEENLVKRVQNGRAKRPVLKYETIITEPVVGTWGE